MHCSRYRYSHSHAIQSSSNRKQIPKFLLSFVQQMCQMLVGVAQSCGIEIVDRLDPEEYQQFLEERKVVVENQRKELQETRDAKMLRTG